MSQEADESTVVLPPYIGDKPSYRQQRSRFLGDTDSPVSYAKMRAEETELQREAFRKAGEERIVMACDGKPFDPNKVCQHSHVVACEKCRRIKPELPLAMYPAGGFRLSGRGA